ncbi:ABC transporter permease [Pelomonas sp. SE-A7]|uniref:ABC transporter permease n=1 Tax=Pelomonas sp. SE-A7 TaxID=3054953 RepID=UPI00259C91F8|nr:ABC transporter permease [Pelomonas sp. SE-A7]MDM4768030.1 ABC transporter permease [Pelomonas sp. SE-A7]
MMLGYYLDLALRAFRRSRALSALMVLGLGLGIGACMTTLSVYHVLSGDPIPGKSERLFNVQLDAGGLVGFQVGQDPTHQLTRFDAEALLRDKRAPRQVMMSGGRVSVRPETGKAFFTTGRYTSADFFTMFEAPFAHGSGWNAEADAAAARVIVISHELNERLFGGGNNVGKTLTIRGMEMQIQGVLKPWRPTPHFYDLTLGHYAKPEDVYIPFATAIPARFQVSGDQNCWGEAPGGDSRGPNAPCAWVQYWVELASAADAPAFRDYLKQYSEAQRKAGRFQRPANARLRPVMDWLAHKNVLPGDIKLQVWLAFGFLLVCLTNAVGLLLAKCLRRSGEIGVRRALGASRSAIFAQFLVEAGVLGVAGGLLGLVLAWLGLWLVRLGPNDYASLATMDWEMLGLTLSLAFGASLVAGLLPAWKAASVTPALQLKTQ